jgi:glycerol-3-phosphate acyltransferase PlsY
VPAPLALVVAYLIGSIPISFIVARVASGVDLRTHGTGTVSGSNVGRASGFTAMAVAGVLDIAKGAVAVLPVTGTTTAATAAAFGVVVGHNWSVFLRGAGGRGLSPALGVLLVLAWPGVVVLGAGLALGKLAGETGLGSFLSQAALPGVLAAVRGTDGLWLGLAVLIPMWVKRVTGNYPLPRERRLSVAVHRLLKDHDPTV